MAIHWLDHAIVVAYLLGMLAVGWWVSRRVRGFTDFFLAGRALTTPMLICTLVSTYYGLDVLLGNSGDASKEGVVVWFAYTRPFTLTVFVAALLIARRFEGTGYLSIPDILADHYGRAAQVLGACASFVYALPILAIMGLAALGAVLFDWPLWLGAVVGSLLAAAYTVMGGFLADALTDTVQFVIMCVSLAVALPLALAEVGGFEGIRSALPPDQAAGFFAPLGTAPPLYTVALGCTALSVLVEPAFYQRLFAARDRRTVRNALLWGMVLWAAYDWAVVAIGMVGAAMQASGTLPGDLPADQVLLRVVSITLPIGLTGFFLGGVLATAMSTIDSYLLISAGNVVYDVYRPLFRPGLDDRALVRGVRLAIVGSAAIAIGLGLTFERIKEAWVFMATALTGSVLVPVLVAMWRGPVDTARRRWPRAGAWSVGGGLLTTVGYYVALGVWGVRNEDLATQELAVAGITLLQEYALFFALPVSAAGFAVGAALDRAR